MTRTPIRQEEWDQYKSIIKELYLHRDLKMREVINIMAREHGFEMSKRQFESKVISEWRLTKNINASDRHAMSRIRDRRRKVDGKDTVFIIRGRAISRQKIQRLDRGLPLVPLGNELQANPDSMDVRTPSDVEYHTPEGSPCIRTSQEPSEVNFSNSIFDFESFVSPMDSDNIQQEPVVHSGIDNSNTSLSGTMSTMSTCSTFDARVTPEHPYKYPKEYSANSVLTQEKEPSRTLVQSLEDPGRLETLNTDQRPQGREISRTTCIYKQSKVLGSRGGYACPFRQRNRLRFNVRTYKDCALQEWPTLLSLKRHIKSCHTQPIGSNQQAHICVRCQKAFPAHEELIDHMRAPSDRICTYRAPKEDHRTHEPEDGIDKKVESMLSDRKQKINTWESLWRLLFPEDNIIPSPELIPTIELEEVEDVIMSHLRSGLREAMIRKLASIDVPMRNASVERILSELASASQEYILRGFHKCRESIGQGLRPTSPDVPAPGRFDLVTSVSSPPNSSFSAEGLGTAWNDAEPEEGWLGPPMTDTYSWPHDISEVSDNFDLSELIDINEE